MTKAITVAGLHKSFGRTHALDGLDLDVETGEVHGFLGPNGAGKSTTIRVLLGLLRADSGAAQLLGKDPWHQAVELHRRLAYVPGDVELWPSLTGGEAIDLLSRLRGGVDTRRRDALVERFDLTRRRRAAPTPRATGRRWRSSPPSPPTPNCCSWTSPRPASTR
ncbi:Daunorubicin/doxorubicin resistance ATP-binding protein DrrA [Streptomyces sp. YIM 130001]|nr:Daunorubicin/doxorubicin resistance ATP-binding protein DrrA [Streptomyces sp. YIM 130001]